jgi:hypothetical protein
MTNEQHLILDQLHSGPESLHDLWKHLRATMTMGAILTALWDLQDAKQAMFVTTDGMWRLR